MGENTKIEKLNLSVRAYNCLKQEGINTIEDLQRYSIASLLNTRNIGLKTLREINIAEQEYYRI